MSKGKVDKVSIHRATCPSGSLKLKSHLSEPMISSQQKTIAHTDSAGST